MLIATAGHVDHGKTTLVRALTGTDCDRLDEEKARGITIVLGYAEWLLPSGRSISIVDVPGHEKLVKTMLAGAGGLDAVVVAISAVAGVMPQTREHLNACALLGVDRAIVAMTFADRVDEPNEAIEKIRRELHETPYPKVDIIPVSAITGQGLSDLSRRVDRLLEQSPERALLPPCLPIDRTFSIDGFGTVVTGSLLRGTLSVGQTVSLLPGGETARIRGMEIHGTSVETAVSACRLALNLTCSRELIPSVALLTLPDTVHSGRVFDAEVTWLSHAARPLKRRRGMTLHLGTASALADVHAKAEILPGSRGPVRVRLDRTIPLPPGMRFVLRGAQDHLHGSVIAGGRIIDPAPPRRRSPEARSALSNASTDLAMSQLIQESGRRGIASSELSRRLPLPLSDGTEHHFDPGHIQTELETLVAKVRAYHASHPASSGIPKAELMSDALSTTALNKTLESGVLVPVDGYIAAPEHKDERDPELDRMTRKVIRAVGRSGLAGPSVDELLRRFPADNRLVRDAIKRLREDARLIVTDGLCFPAREAIALRTTLARHVLTVDRVSVSWLKTETGLSRKHAIPLWTWLDACGTTIRQGDHRIAGPRAQEQAHE